MATAEDIARLNTAVRALAQLVFDAAQQAFPESAQWSVVVLDVRYAADGRSFVDKTRVTLANGEVTGCQLAPEYALQLISLGDARPSGQDRWFGMRLEVTSTGKCTVQLDYDPTCADNSRFFES
jgi:hypothetical protein